MGGAACGRSLAVLRAFPARHWQFDRQVFQQGLEQLGGQGQCQRPATICSRSYPQTICARLHARDLVVPPPHRWGDDGAVRDAA